MTAPESVVAAAGLLSITEILQSSAKGRDAIGIPGIFNGIALLVRVVFQIEQDLRHRSLDGIEAIGVDEVQWQRGHSYVTLVYQIDTGARRLLYVGKNRTVRSLLGFFRQMGPEVTASIRYVCSDMWKPYLKVIARKIPQALHVLHRFHIVANLGKALNEVRAAEARRMRTEGYEEVLTHTKYCFLKNPENLTKKQKLKLDDVLQYDLKSVRAYLLKEAFQYLWSYKSPAWAKWYLDKWCARAMRSQLEPIKRFVRSIRRHQPLILNYFHAKKQLSSGIAEAPADFVESLQSACFPYLSD